MINEKNIFEKGMLISIRAGSYAGRKKMSKEQLKELPTEIVRGVHDLFDKDFKKFLTEIISLDLQARLKVRAMAIPFPIDGICFLTSTKIDDAVNFLEETIKEREKMVENILDNYQAAVKIFEEKYPDYYRHAKNDYPTLAALRDRFYFRYQFIRVAPPEKDSIITGDQYKKEMSKFKDTIDEMKKEVVALIYEELLEVTARLKKQCTDGTPNQRTFNTLNAFLQKIDEVYMDFVDRKDMKEAIKKVKAQVLGVTAESLRDSEAAKKDFTKALKEVSAEIQALPDIPLKRAIEF